MSWSVVCLVLAVALTPRAVGAQDPVCDIPEGHTDGEETTIGEPNGFESLLARCSKFTMIQKIIRRCEARYCCTAGCNCTDHEALHEQSTTCAQPENTVELSCYVEDRVGPIYGELLSCCAGYQFDKNRICVKSINCSIDNGGCAQTCVQGELNGMCTCREGYESYNSTKCRDIDECTHGLSECEHNCVNTGGSYTCTCNPGYRLHSDGEHCTAENIEPKAVSKPEEGFPWVYGLAIPLAGVVLLVVLIFAICGLRSYKKKTRRLREEGRQSATQMPPLQISPIDLQLLQPQLTANGSPLTHPSNYPPPYLQVENNYENLASGVEVRHSQKSKALPPLPLDEKDGYDNPIDLFDEEKSAYSYKTSILTDEQDNVDLVKVPLDDKSFV